MNIIVLYFLLVFLLIASATLSASETSMFSLSTFTINSYRYNKDKRKQTIAKLLKNPRELLVTIMMLNIFCNVLVQNTVSNLFGNFSSWIIKVGLPLFLTLFFGEVLPKSFALPNNKSFSYKIAPTLSVTSKVLSPIRKVLTTITSYVSRIMFFFLKKEKPLSIEELQHVLDISKKKNIIVSQEYELISGYLDLHEAFLKEHMRPKEEIIFYDINKPLDDLLSYFMDKECSRIPVCNKDINNILGVMTARRFFFYQDKIKNPQLLKIFLKNPFYLPETTICWTALQQLREKKEDMALVVDEYGNISGLITEEDLIETVVGEIEDLRDEEKEYTVCSNDTIIASGKLELDEFEDIFHVKLKSELNVATIGGWLIEQFEDIPQAGEKVIKDNFLFYILSAKPNRIKRVYIRKLSKK